jgi:cell division protein FtsL
MIKGRYPQPAAALPESAAPAANAGLSESAASPKSGAHIDSSTSPKSGVYNGSSTSPKSGVYNGSSASPESRAPLESAAAPAAAQPDQTRGEPQSRPDRELSARKQRNKVRRIYVLMIFVSFIFAIALIYRYSLAIEINDRIIREKAVLSKMENENSLAQMQIASETDLEKIRILAESRLGMQKPDKDQIYYIKVPRRDHALIAAPAQSHETGMPNPFTYLYEQIILIRNRLITD